MAKVKGPILSISATGQLAKAMVFASWRGVPYARQHVVPNNPRTTAQTTTRNTFANIDDHWKRMATIGRRPWEAVTRGRPLTGRNALIRDNLPLVRGQADMTNWLGSPGALGGLSATALTIAPNGTPGELEFTITAPQEPVDWTLRAAVAIAFQDRDPAVQMADFQVEAEDLAPVADGDTVITLAGLEGGVLYVGSAWLEWTRPDGVIAYGTSLTDTATPDS